MFVPGSIRLNGAVVTDAGGDDLGAFAGGSVVVRLGTGATPGAGGLLAPGASATVSFQVRVATTGLEVGATIENTAELSFQAATTRVPSTVATAPAVTQVLVPDLAIGKSHAPDLAPGQPSTYTITVGNVGDGPTAGLVTVTDTIESPGLTINGAGHRRRLDVHDVGVDGHLHALRPAPRRQRLPADLDPGARQPSSANPGRSATRPACRRRATATPTTTPSPTREP